jgi:pimeloyl-ACP methyl ester carboxylesterase
VHQQIKFCTARDGARIAWARHGSGPPLVKTSNWLTHLENDWESPVWRYWLEGLGQSHSVVRYDERGCGLSDRDVGDPSIEQWVSDLETVVDAAAIERFNLLVRDLAGGGDRDRVCGASPGAGGADGSLRRLRARAQPSRRR